MKKIYTLFILITAMASTALAQSPFTIPNNVCSLGRTGAANKTIEFNLTKAGATANPKIRWNTSLSRMEISNDGSTFAAMFPVSTNTASTPVLRDASGNFSAGTVSATNVTASAALTGATLAVTSTGTVPGAITVNTTAPNAANGPLTIDNNGSSGSFAIKQATISRSFLQFHPGGTVVISGNGTANYDSGAEINGKASGKGLSVYNSSTSPGDILSLRASDYSTVLMKVDNAGNATATSFVGPVTGNVTGNLTGNVTGNTSGSAGTVTGSFSGDVTGTQSAMVISAATVTGKAITGFSSTTGAVTAADTILSAINKLFGNWNSELKIITAKFGGAGTSNCGSSPCTLYVNKDNTGSAWVTSATRASAGIYTVNFASGTFSGDYSCTVGCTDVAGGGSNFGAPYSYSSTSFNIKCWNGVPTAGDSLPAVICAGPR